ncbi:hypothetical protein [Stutzerimonas tarimensis]
MTLPCSSAIEPNDSFGEERPAYEPSRHPLAIIDIDNCGCQSSALAPWDASAQPRHKTANKNNANEIFTSIYYGVAITLDIRLLRNAQFDPMNFI